MNPFVILTLATSLTTLVLPRVATAHSDIFLAAQNGRVAVGSLHEHDDGDEHFELGARVFEGVAIANFPPINPADYGRAEPGFVGLASGNPDMPAGATALPGNTAVSIQPATFTIGANTDSLFYWSGNGSIDFQPVSAVQPGVQLSLDPNPIGTTSASGLLHAHPTFAIDNGGAGVPADGVYLAALSATAPGLDDSAPFYMVWLVDALLADEDAAEGLEEAIESGQTMYLGRDFAFFEQAVEYVEQQIVPEPTGGLLGFMAIAAAASAFANPRLCNREVN